MQIERWFGTIKLKRALKRRDAPLNASKRRIGKIMKKYNLVSKYTQRAKGKRAKKEDANTTNNENKPNIVERNWQNRQPLEVVVSDLIYVKVANIWYYICLLLDVATREIIGYVAGKKRDAKLVKSSICRADVDLRKIDILHTDRGVEFKNEILDEIIHAFGMRRSLSKKGTPVDNGLMESMYNCLKAEFVYNETFHNLANFELELFQYVNWYNNHRPHGGLKQLTPREYKLMLKER